MTSSTIMTSSSSNNQLTHDTSSSSILTINTTNTNQQLSGNMSQLMLDIVMKDKLQANIKKHVEVSTRNKLSSLPFISHISSKTKICVIVVSWTFYQVTIALVQTVYNSLFGWPVDSPISKLAILPHAPHGPNQPSNIPCIAWGSRFLLYTWNKP